MGKLGTLAIDSHGGTIRMMQREVWIKPRRAGGVVQAFLAEPDPQIRILKSEILKSIFSV